jgi:hypothetical protein
VDAEDEVAEELLARHVSSAATALSCAIATTMVKK